MKLRRAVRAGVAAGLAGAVAGCSDRTNGGTFPASPPAEVRKNAFDNPPLGDPLSQNPADLKGFAAEKAGRARRR